MEASEEVGEEEYEVTEDARRASCHCASESAPSSSIRIFRNNGAKKALVTQHGEEGNQKKEGRR